MSNKEKYKWEIDVPVLLIFFNRPGCFAKVFEQVKKARPSKLFLYQDGAREGNEQDEICVKQCRDIALDIDWECELYTKFQEKNYGCDPSGYIARKWSFEYVDKCISIEDDCVPNQSFFPFCKELLDKYENDERINMICGMNNLETWGSPYSYLFSETGSIWGWATWKRVFDQWEPDYDLLGDSFNRQKLSNYLSSQWKDNTSKFNTWDMNKASGTQHFETLCGVNQYANSMLNIVPAKNMIINIGNTPEGGTHSVDDLSLIPKGLRRIYTMNSYEIDFPLNHPKYVINDVDFQKQLFRVMGTGHPFVNKYRNIEKAFLLLRYKGLKAMINKVRKKFGE